MKIFGDYHSHTNYSHGKNTITEMAASAREKGLSELAITEHSFNSWFALNYAKLEKMRRETMQINATGEYPHIMLGAEANLISQRGEIDVTAEDFDLLDIVIMGYHSSARVSHFSDVFTMYFGNQFERTFGSNRQRLSNTEAIIKAIERNPIAVLVHPGHKYTVDLPAVCEACRDIGVFMELSSHHRNLSEAELRQLADSGVGLIVNSDAHNIADVANVDYALSVKDTLGIPDEQIVNLFRRPDFRTK